MPHTESKLTLQQLHDELMQMYNKCPDDENCPFCAADRQAEAHERGDYSADSQWSDEDKQNWATDCRERARDMNRR